MTRSPRMTLIEVTSATRLLSLALAASVTFGLLAGVDSLATTPVPNAYLAGLVTPTKG